MPKDSKVHRCVVEVMKQGYTKKEAIKICQDKTGQSYMTGKKIKKK